MCQCWVVVLEMKEDRLEDLIDTNVNMVQTSLSGLKSNVGGDKPTYKARTKSMEVTLLYGTGSR